MNPVSGMRKRILFYSGLLVLIVFGVFIFFSFFQNSQNEADLPNGKATITIDARRVIGKVNRSIFGTTMSEPRSVSRKRDDFSNPELTRLLNELEPRFINISNTSGGIPFFPEGTGLYEKRMTHEQILDRMHFTSDPEGKIFYEKIKTDPAFQKPPDYNIDDTLQYFESLKVKPGIAFRIPTIFTLFGGESKGKLNLDPQTGSDLVHYLNDPVTTQLGKLRAQNGHPASYNVKYFVLGNEMWNSILDQGLSYEQVTSQHIAFAKAMKVADPTIKIGFNLSDDSLPYEFYKPSFWKLERTKKGIDFNDQILSRIKGYFDFVTYHIYADVGTDGEGRDPTSLTPSEWKLVMAQTYFYEKNKGYERRLEIAKKYNPNVEVISDEYSGPLASLGGALFAADHIMHLLEKNYDGYGGYWNSGMFEPFTRFGLIQVPDDLYPHYFVRPAFYTLELFNKYFGDQMVETKVSSDTYELTNTETVHLVFPREQIPSIKAIASISGDSLSLFVLNRATNQNIETTIDIKGLIPMGVGTVYTLDGQSLNATNEDAPDTVKVRESVIPASESFTYTFKKHSLTVFKFER
ncbi:MAG: Alpha-L-arabinofuranosidase [Parcubacteria group bacterium GW2011_GWF2_44_8b]|nr:MAG: Alpha-L-arabinofuranosidase [Parcubacteria group bacterium GW2011_GWC1_43_30]KKT80590.1 MAG: Alpha-L-arabinofuranosidase [Parcubacteria group bacterium GW2011_GWF2_44_8b]KKT85847.1 MAG: Alpha-L-arabinofuranosidase [Parcubacteria group bacterium GW2011_GWD1_44_9]